MGASGILRFSRRFARFFATVAVAVAATEVPARPAGPYPSVSSSATTDEKPDPSSVQTASPTRIAETHPHRRTSATEGAGVLSDDKNDKTEIIDTVISVDGVQVTAIKQGLSLRNRSVAASVAGRRTIERQGITAVKELSRLVPNFYIPDYGSRMTSSIYVRGLGARIDQPVMGLNVDNVPYLSKDDYDFDLTDIERIEVLRGPQSTLYGRNTMGGVINVYTLSPLAYQGTRLGAEYASGNTLRLRASTCLRPSEHTGISVSARYLRSDGLFTNDFTGETCDTEQSGGVRIRLQFRPDDRWSVDNTFSIGLLDQGGYPYASVATGRIAYNDPAGYRRTSLNDGLTVRYTAERWEIASITSYQFSDDRMTLDQDFLPESYFTLTQAKQDHAVTEDLVLQSRGTGRYQWLVGAFGFYRHRTMQAPVLFKRTGIERLILDNSNTDDDLVYSMDADELLLSSEFRNPVYGAALYHESRLRAGRWLFTAGLRADFEHTRLRYRSRADMAYAVSINGAAPLPAEIHIDESNRIAHSYVEILPSLSAAWNLNARNNLYLSIARGYKAGGFNTQMFSDILQEKIKWQMVSGLAYDEPDLMSYEPEYSWNYEIGGHFASAEGTLRGDFALFWIDCRNQQLTVFPEGQTTGRMMTNAGRTWSRGAELSLQIHPHRSLEFDLAYGFTDARFRRYDTTVEAADGTPQRISYKGNYLPYVPQHTLAGTATWSRPTGVEWLGDVVLQIGVKATGPIRWNEENTRKQPFYALADATLRFEHDRCAVSLWGRNLAGTRYEVFYFKSIGNEFVQYGRPRTFGISLDINIRNDKKR